MIDQIELTNFKAFRGVTLPLAPFTLLSGINASGKSTVLQALAVLRQSFVERALQEGGLLLNGDLVELGTGQDVLHEDYEASSDGTPRIAIGIRDADQHVKWTAEYEPSADVLRLTEDSSSPDGISLFGPGFQYLKADRLGPAVFYPRSLQAAVREGSLGALGQHTANYLREQQDAEVTNPALLHPEVESHRLLDQVNAWMQELCPGINLQTSSVEGTDLVRIDYGFFGTAGLTSTNRYRPTNVGFGLSFVLPVVVALMTAQDGRLILIENPEAHLHPRGQVMMGRLAARAATSDCRVLIESHSDHFLNGLRLAVKEGVLPPSRVALHYLARTVEGEVLVESPILDAAGMLSGWPSGFFDEWENALTELLG